MGRPRHISFSLIFIIVLAISVLLVRQSSLSTGSGKSLRFTGVNLPSAAFNSDQLPGKPNHDYIFPGAATIDYFSSKGMNIIRLGVLWERLQHQLGAPLDKDEMQRMDNVVRYAGSKGMKTIIDIHNYAKYKKVAIGARDVPPSALADLWGRIGAHYKNNDLVVFGLMNEPTGLPTETWLRAANMSIEAIRKAGARNLILVPGNGWTSARDWMSIEYGTPNSQVMLNVVDPGGAFAFDVHQYFDRDFTGTHADCQSVDVGINSLAPFTKWARKHGMRGFLGEFGVGSNRKCLEVLNRVLEFMEANSDVWLGWTYWAAGPWWPKDYYTNIEPLDGNDRPQMSVLKKHTHVDKPLRINQ
jgi:endoglucanase